LNVSIFQEKNRNEHNGEKYGPFLLTRHWICECEAL
jgi:hypothetical protein